VHAGLGLLVNSVQRTAPPYSACRDLSLIFQTEKGSAPLVQIPSLWAESDPSPLSLYFAIGKGQANSARLLFLYSRAWEFHQQSDSAAERSLHLPHAFSSIAKQVAHSLLPQRVPRPLAFLPA
jgi:hypothetical protein